MIKKLAYILRIFLKLAHKTVGFRFQILLVMWKYTRVNALLQIMVQILGSRSSMLALDWHPQQALPTSKQGAPVFYACAFLLCAFLLCPPLPELTLVPSDAGFLQHSVFRKGVSQNRMEPRQRVWRGYRQRNAQDRVCLRC